MAEETQYTADTGLGTVSTANSNLNGTGTIATILSIPAGNGTLLKRVWIKAQGDTTQGMIRLYTTDHGTTRIFREIEVPAVDASSIDPTFETYVDLDMSFSQSKNLAASTQNAESFNIIAEAMKWAYYSTSVRTDTTQYTAVTGIASLTTASTKVLLLTAGLNGCSVESITVKGVNTTADGIIELYIYDGTTYYLFREVKVTAVTQSGIAHTYEYNMVFEDDFELESGFSLYVATKQTQTFSVIAEGLNWEYPA